MKKREIMRSIFCGLAAGALFLALFLGIGWNFIVAVLLAGGLFLGAFSHHETEKDPGKDSPGYEAGRRLSEGKAGRSKGGF